MSRSRYKAHDDQSLWTLWKERKDGLAGGVLCDRYFFDVLRFFSTKVRVDRDAEDLAQKTFLELSRSNASPQSVKGYVFGIARIVLIHYIRGLNRLPAPLDTEVHSLAELDPGPGLTTLVAQDLDRARLAAVLRTLPIDTQIVLELYYWEELAGSELAIVLDVPEGTVRGRIAAAKRRLREALDGGSTHTDASQEMRGLGSWVRAIRERLKLPEPA